MKFRYFIVISPWKRAKARSSKDLLPRLIEISTVVLEKQIFKFVNIFSLFCYYLALEKSVVGHLNKLESPSPKDTLYQAWLKLVQWFVRRRRKCEKFTTPTTTTTPTNNGQIVIRKSSLEPSAQVS